MPENENDQTEYESAYMKSIKNYSEALRAASRVADDPFKAPEVVVETASHVVRAAWNMQVEYAVMLRLSSG